MPIATHCGGMPANDTISGTHFLRSDIFFSMGLMFDGFGQPLPINASQTRRHERRHHVFLDLSFLLDILLGWMRRSAFAARRHRLVQASLPSRTDCPGTGLPLAGRGEQNRAKAMGPDPSRQNQPHREAKP